jgi:uncharacterized protein
MEFAIVIFVTLLVSGLTLYSGFGLGTLLMPVFALFFPIEVAVASTAVVHAANSIFKVAAVGRHSDRSIVFRFGIPSVIAAFIGAYALGHISHYEKLAAYRLGTHMAEITPVKLIMGVLILLFSLFEILPVLRKLGFNRRYMAVGGILSGFFGGFSGHQGALRSAFLVKIGISPEAFIGTNAIIGLLVDIARIATYAFVFLTAGTGKPVFTNQFPLIAAGIIASLFGVMLGKHFLQKVTMSFVQTLTGIMLLIIAIALGLGII